MVQSHFENDSMCVCDGMVGSIRASGMTKNVEWSSVADPLDSGRRFGSTQPRQQKKKTKKKRSPSKKPMKKKND